MVPFPPTSDLPAIRKALESAEAMLGDSMRHLNVFFYVLVALVQAVCAVADAINNLADRVPDA